MLNFSVPSVALASVAAFGFASSASGAVMENFEDGTADGFVVVDGNGSAKTVDGAFSVVTEGSNNIYSQTNSGMENGDSEGGTGAGKAGGYALLGETFTGINASVDVRVNDDNGFGDAALLFGQQDNDNYYLVVFNQDAANNEVFSLVGDVRTQIGPDFDGNGGATDSSFTAGVFRTVTLTHDPILGNVTLGIDGTEVYNVTDTAFTTFASGGFGVGAINDSASFDNVNVSSIPEPASLALASIGGCLLLGRRRGNAGR